MTRGEAREKYINLYWAYTYYISIQRVKRDEDTRLSSSVGRFSLTNFNDDVTIVKMFLY